MKNKDGEQSHAKEGSVQNVEQLRETYSANDTEIAAHFDEFARLCDEKKNIFDQKLREKFENKKAEFESLADRIDVEVPHILKNTLQLVDVKKIETQEWFLNVLDEIIRDMRKIVVAQELLEIKNKKHTKKGTEKASKKTRKKKTAPKKTVIHGEARILTTEELRQKATQAERDFTDKVVGIMKETTDVKRLSELSKLTMRWMMCKNKKMHIVNILQKYNNTLHKKHHLTVLKMFCAPAQIMIQCKVQKVIIQIL